jgi:uncharacterized membrane protein
MTKKLLIFTIISLITFVSYKATFALLPNFIYNRFYTKSLEAPDRQENKFFMLLSPDENARAVVKPNPDFSYGIAFYNLKEGPLRISGSIPKSTYWSIAFYSPNTINYFVKNDQEFNGSSFDIILDQKTCAQASLHSPTDKGLILIRYLCKNQSAQELELASNHLNSLKIESYSCSE